MTVKKRKEYLKYLGFYKGTIDNKVNSEYNKAIKEIQDKYFFNKKDKDGIAGKNTDILIESAYNVKRYTNNFDLLEDKLYCHCKGKYCTGYPAIINKNLLVNLQNERLYSGATTVSSMLRCKKYNSTIGGVRGSKHTKGKAVDFQNKNTKTLKERKKTVDRWIKMKNSSYSYCNGYGRRKLLTYRPVAKNMGSSVHGDVL